MVKQGPSKYFTLAMKLLKNQFELEKISSWFQTGKKSSSSNSIFQTGEFEKSSADRQGVWAILDFCYLIIFFPPSS